MEAEREKTVLQEPADRGSKGRARRLFLRGVVQGVGFRPFVYHLARGLGLAGWVNNSSAGVHITVEGRGEAIERFTREILEKAPPQARIEGLQFEDTEPAGFSAFEIRGSLAEEGRYQLISPDIATCPDCLKEVLDPGDRRHGYPFTNCTNCGPRFTIIRDIPYDRPRTTMDKFPLCPECRREYEDPADRRFHAQPNACPVCGPRLTLADEKGKALGGDPLSAAVGLLRQGKILAVKGLGGFLLACNARDPEVVSSLRRRKNRPDKPFAVMLEDLFSAREHCTVNGAEEKLLLSPESPIVLLPWKETSSIAAEVAPGQNYLGVMLPYTPLHHLLLRESGMALVMTSGNGSEEPIARENEEALRRLSGIADAFLLHDRDIYVSYDDSVTAVVAGGARVLRRARGYAPFPIRLPWDAKRVLALGAEMKNTFCLTRDRYAFVSQHLGDLESLETLNHFQRTLNIYRRLFRLEPEIVAHDLHPEYLATKLARQLPGPKVGVQHHFAHLASCLAENGKEGPVIGITFDGLGYGLDGKLWGGEFLLGDLWSFSRQAHLEYVPLPGGAAAIRHPWRMALAYLYSFLGEEGLMSGLFLPGGTGQESLRLLQQQMDRKINSPLTSSCGRLFDGVSALLGLCPSVSYEGQAAIALEMAADPEEGGRYDFFLEEEDGLDVVRLKPLLQGLLGDIAAGVGGPKISGRFHNTLVEIGRAVCGRIAGKGGPRKAALTGGVFQNRLLTERMKAALERDGFEVLLHRLVPCNDDGLSLGQAIVASFASDRAERGEHGERSWV
ncbi:MAG: carbamoyltransferase HypF [Deltaproteobacteria bacterium]|nr:carbamoyltransferase HypF [Deltaproteobacteria bacterium]